MPILGSIGAAAAKGFGMLGKIAAAVDEYFEYVTLLLHGNGTNGAQNNTFLDSSTNNFTITRNGNTTQGTFTPYGANWSNYFDGSGDYFSIADNAAFDIGTGDFSLEAWVYMPSVSGVQGIASNKSSQTSGGFGFYINSATPNAQVFTAGTENADTVTGPNITANQWFHIAAVRTSGTFRLYVNGVGGTSISSSRNGDNTSAFQIGLYEGSLYPFTGYISNLRLIKGSGPYNAANSTITVPTSPLTAITNTSLLTCQSNRFIDNSSNNFTITRNGDVSVQRFSPFNPTTPYAAGTIGGSGYFDGSGDYLDVGSSSSLAPGSGVFTWECWLFPNSFTQDGSGGTTLWISNTTNGLQIGRQSTGAGSGWGIAASGTAWRLTSTTLPTNGQWNHLAISRDGSNNTAIFLNGTRIASGSVTDTFATASTYVGGGPGSGQYSVNGYLSGVRFVKGTAVYDPTQSTLTVPTAPLTAVTNTQLLLNFTNGGIIDNAMMNDLETVGNAQISTSVSKFGGGSMYFDGNGDRLVGRNTPNLNFGSGDWTVEFWIYATDQAIGPIVNQCSQASSAGWGIWAYNGASGVNRKLTVFLNGANFSLVTGSDVWASNTWTHIAVVKSGTNLTVYSNGVNAASSSSAPATITDTTAPPMVGAVVSGTNWGVSYDFTGYIDDLRITKGYARYTANFTAPTAPFPDQ